MDKAASKQQVGAMELLSIAGFAFYIGWMLCSFYWLFTSFPPDYSFAERSGLQAVILAGVLLGYIFLYAFTRKYRSKMHRKTLRAVFLAFLFLIPLAALLASVGVVLPWPLIAVFCLLSGMGASFFTVSWLDASGRVRIRSYPAFTSASFASGALFFLLISFMPEMAQPMFCIAFALSSAALMQYVSSKADSSDEEVAIAPRKEYLKFAKELEPSFFAFGIVFGLSFVFLFRQGTMAVFWGLTSVIVGALAVFAADLLGKRVSITIVQRILLCVTVGMCLVMPFAPAPIQIVCACVLVAAWAAFTCTNYALLTQKSVEKKLSVFLHAPTGLSFSAGGFLTGWVISTTLIAFGVSSDVFMMVRLGMAFVLVFVVMLFFPVSHHHDLGMDEAVESKPSIVPPGVSEREIFEAKCAEVAKLYQLSPRESDILGYLAKGRNAGYIQNKLTISPHTVKSHIYSIYRKLDIHSQQKLMDFVEEYPVEIGERPSR